MALYLVTGGAGFIGSHLVDALVARGDRARVLDSLVSGDRRNLAGHRTGDLGSGAPVELAVGDIRDRDLVRRASVGVAGVLHEAAQVSVPRSIEDPHASYEVNVMGTLNLLEAARLAGVPRFVFAASSAAYGDTEELPKRESMTPAPRSPYASGKLAGEELLAVWGRQCGMRTVALRYFNIFGPRQADDSPYTGVIAIFARALLGGRQATIHGDGEQSRDFTYVANAVRANLLALEADVEPGAVFNVGTGTRATILEIYRLMAELLGREAHPQFTPQRAGDVRHSQACLERARALLRYSPDVTLREGLRETVRWYAERRAKA
jgi:nucleoside-diphosphate-sugar epimerase